MRGVADGEVKVNAAFEEAVAKKFGKVKKGTRT